VELEVIELVYRTVVPGFVTKELHDGEHVLGTFRVAVTTDPKEGSGNAHNCIALTDDRLITYKATMTGGSWDATSYASVLRVQVKKGWLSRTVTSVTTDRSITIGRLGKKDASFVAGIINARIAGRILLTRA